MRWRRQFWMPVQRRSEFVAFEIAAAAIPKWTGRMLSPSLHQFRKRVQRLNGDNCESWHIESAATDAKRKTQSQLNVPVFSQRAVESQHWIEPFLAVLQ